MFNEKITNFYVSAGAALCTFLSIDKHLVLSIVQFTALPVIKQDYIANINLVTIFTKLMSQTSGLTIIFFHSF